MKKLSIPQRWKVLLSGLFIFLWAIFIIYLTLPEGFRYDSDANLSGVGMALSKTYLNPPLQAPKNYQGYITNGRLDVYNNWPSLSFKSLALWFKLVNDDSLYSARVFSVLIYGINAVLFFILLIKNKISIQVATLSSVVFAVLPFHLRYGSLVYADIWLVTFWLSASLFYTLQKKFNTMVYLLSLF